MSQQHISFLATPQGSMWYSTTPNLCVVSSIWTTHWATNGPISRFYFGASTPSYLFRMLSDGIFEAHCAQILSCYGPRVGVWFITWSVFPTFWLSSPFLSTTLRTWLGLPHPSIASIFQCVCTHPIDPMGIHLLCCVHGNERIGIHDAIYITLSPLCEMLSSTWDENNYKCFL
jgi:hypothetical protein